MRLACGRATPNRKANGRISAERGCVAIRRTLHAELPEVMVEMLPAQHPPFLARHRTEQRLHRPLHSRLPRAHPVDQYMQPPPRPSRHPAGVVVNISGGALMRAFGHGAQWTNICRNARKRRSPVIVLASVRPSRNRIGPGRDSMSPSATRNWSATWQDHLARLHGPPLPDALRRKEIDPLMNRRSCRSIKECRHSLAVWTISSQRHVRQVVDAEEVAQETSH